MFLPDLSIRRPVLATVMSLVVVLVGIIAYDRLTVREYPKIDEPVVTVETTFKGASADIVESQVTQILEESLAGIEGIDYMSSISRPERSQITARFRLDREPDAAANDVRDRAARVRGRLPDEIEEPIVSKVEADAQPILYLAFSSDRHSAMDVTDFADRFVKDRLQNLSGVADVRIFGERRYSMRIWLDRARLAAYRLTPADVEQALRRQNVEIPAGRIESQAREFTVVTETDLRTPAQFESVVLREESAYPIRLGDVGRAEFGPENERVNVRFNGRSAVALGVVKQATANPLDVSQAVRAELPAIQQDLPEGMRTDLAYDSSIFIRESIDAVFTTIAEAVVLVVLVIFFFLRSLRATLIPLVTIPVSLVGAFALMYAFGFSINTLTLLAMVLAVGLVVDDAIVMLENIHRHVEEGMAPFQAALAGAREIGFAVLAMTVTLASVYAPIGFMTGRTGKLFTEFALALAGAVLVSGFVALSLSPMMCSKMLRHVERHGLLYRVIESGIVLVTRGYRRALAATLEARWLVVLAGLQVAGASYFLFTTLKSELAPIEDRGTIVSIGVAPEGSTLEFTDKYAQQMEELFRQVPEIRQYFVVTGFPVVSQVIAFSRLKDWGERARKQQEVVAEIGPKMFGIPGLLAFATNPPSLGQSPVEKPVQFVVQTAAPYAELQKMVDALLAEARNYPGMVNLDTDLKLNKPELKVDLDREKVANIGLEVDTVGRTLETMLGGRQVTRFKREGKQYDVIVQVADVDRRNPDDLATIYVRNDDGVMIPMNNIITLTERVAPKELNHFNKLRSATITATLAPGYTLGDALTYPAGRRDARAARLGAGRLRRPVARVQGELDQPLHHLPARARLHLPRALGAVRELRRPVRDHADRAAVDDRRVDRLAPLRRHAQRLQPDRPDHAGRADHQARHPDRRVREPAAGAGPRQGRRGGRGGGPQAAPDPDDHGRHGAGRGAARDRDRGRRREPLADRLGDRRRHRLRHAVHAVRGADRLHAARPHAPHGRARPAPLADEALPERQAAE